MLFTKSTSIGECYNIALPFIKTNYEYVLNYFFLTFSQQHLTETLSSPEWKLYAWLAVMFVPPKHNLHAMTYRLYHKRTFDFNLPALLFSYKP